MSDAAGTSCSSARPLTLVEKIAARHLVVDDGGAVGDGATAAPVAGSFVRVRPKHVMTHDNTAAVIPKHKQIFEGLEADGKPVGPSIGNNRQPVFAIDHDIQNNSPENLGKYAKIESFANAHSIDYYKPGTGIGHQVMCERGYVTPGSMVVASDSHSNLYGALAALGTPVVRTDAAVIWATGTTWWRVPPAARVELQGELRDGVTGKDVIIALCGLYNKGEVLNHAVEFVGDGAAKLSMSERMAICNMTTEWGALAGLMPFDETTRDYLYERADAIAGQSDRLTRAHIEALWATRDELRADEGAQYAVELTLDLASVEPCVSGPNSVEVMTPVSELESKDIAIQKAYLLSCVNGRLEDLRAAASVLKGNRVAQGVEFYVAAASEEIEQRAREEGTWAALEEAGAITLPSGCGPCIGLGSGTVEDGEVAISATNRNFKGRMGSRDSQVYLASPVVVAQSVVAGKITAGDGAASAAGALTPSVRTNTAVAAAADGQTIEGFPASITGRAVFIDRDSVNTDGIYAGAHTYKTLPADEMASVVFENLDQTLTSDLQAGDVVVAGANFGTGSSREQAATALKHRGISCVIAHSYSETYRRNAFNNAFVCIECPELVAHLRDTGKGPTDDGRAWTLAGVLLVNFETSTIACDGQQFGFGAIAPVMQELVVAGGAEAVAQQLLSAADTKQNGVEL